MRDSIFDWSWTKFQLERGIRKEMREGGKIEEERGGEKGRGANSLVSFY